MKKDENKISILANNEELVIYYIQIVECGIL